MELIRAHYGFNFKAVLFVLGALVHRGAISLIIIDFKEVLKANVLNKQSASDNI